MRADSNGTTSYNTKAAVGQNAILVAGGNLKVTSDGQTHGSLHAYADGRGFGGGGYANTNFTVSPGSTSDVEVAQQAILLARTLELKALSTATVLSTHSEGYGAGFWGESDDSARVAVTATNQVNVGTGAHVTGTGGVDVISRFTGVNTLADSFGRVTGLFGHTSSDSYNNFNPTTSVTTASAGLFTAAPRELDDPNLEHPTDANLAPKSLDLQHLALFVDTTNPTPTVTSHADSSKRALASGGDDDHGGGHDDAVKSVNWNTDVFIQSGQSPELVVSADGQIIRAINVEVSTSANAHQTSGTIPDDTIHVRDIVNNDPGQVYFNAGTPVGGGTVAMNGSGGTWTFGDTFQKVLITNYSTKTLEVNNIDVVNSTADPLADLEARTGDKDNTGTVTLTFQIKHTVTPTFVDIENLAGSDVQLNGTINNPVGTTVIRDTGSTYTTDSSTSTLNTGDTVTVEQGPLAGQVYQYVGAPLTATTIDLLGQNFADAAKWALRGNIYSTHDRNATPYNVPFETTTRSSLVLTNILDIESAEQGSAGTDIHRVNVDLVYTPSFPAASTYATWQVAASTSSIFLGDNSFFSGEVVRYHTSGSPIGGLVNDAYYTVIESTDRLSIQLATRDAQGVLHVVTLDPAASRNVHAAPADPGGTSHRHRDGRHPARPEGMRATTASTPPRGPSPSRSTRCMRAGTSICCSAIRSCRRPPGRRPASFASRP